MFCEKCGSQIIHDSVYCSYCGKKVETPREEEQQEEEKSEFRPSEMAACIQPHMPKKHCADCKKELPGSTISNLCALCTIRRRNREEEEQRKNVKTDKKRDRYDISDEFDQRVFARSQSSYYREPTEPEQTRAPKSKTRYNAREEEQKDARKQRNKKVAIIAVGIFLMYFGLTTVLPYLIFQSGKEEAVSVSEAFLDQENGSQEASGDEYASPHTLKELQEQYIEPVAKQILAETVEKSSLTSAHSHFTWDGAYIYANGTAVYTEDGVLRTAGYTVCMILSEQQYLAVQVVLGNETLFDNRTYIDTRGIVTKDGAEYFEVPAGTPLFGDEPLFFPDDLESVSLPDTKVQNV